MGKGRALQGEGCKQFVEYFRAQADAYMAMNDADFQAVVDKSPAPSATCCHDARNFVLSGCTCSRQITNSPASASVTPTQLRCITRATQASVCGKPDWINDPCQDNGGRPAVAATTASNAVVTLHPTANTYAASPPAPAAPAPASPAPTPAPPAPTPAPPAPTPAPAAPAPAPAAPAAATAGDASAQCHAVDGYYSVRTPVCLVVESLVWRGAAPLTNIAALVTASKCEESPCLSPS